MPIGSLSIVSHIAKDINLQKVSVLDLGMGAGFYGAVVRQWADMGVQPWKSRIVGVEGFGKYRNPCWDLYDEVHVQPIQQYLSTGGESFDRIFLLDVLEHFSEIDGAAVLDQAKLRLKKKGLFWVGTPGIFCEQGAAHGNEYERHRSLWTADALADRGFEIIKNGELDELGSRMVLGVYREL